MASVIQKGALSAPTLLKVVRAGFAQVTDKRTGRRPISLVDALMSGVAVFGLKYPSLLKFDEGCRDEVVRTNLKNLYGIERAPCDTQLRTLLDPVAPEEVGGAYQALHQHLHRHGVYKAYRYLEGRCLVLVDGTGHFGSGRLSCPDCCVKHTKSGEVRYYHQLLGAVIAHPERAPVLPLASEAITRQDGETKNDCEREAAKRLLRRLKRDYPDLQAVIVEDSLSGNGPHLNVLKELDYRFIIGVKEGDHAALFEQVHQRMLSGTVEEFEEIDEAGVTRGFRYMNGLILNPTHPECVVNYLDYWEVDAKGNTLNFTWISDLVLTRETVDGIMRAGRTRWKIENETFNTLKHLEYHLEHNYGHGHQHLATVLGLLCVLAFLIDQVQAFGCALFQAARRRVWSTTSLWEKLRALFTSFYIRDWEIVWQAISRCHVRYELQPLPEDTS